MSDERSEHIRQSLLENAKEITRLNSRIHDTFKQRDKGPREYEAWKLACAEFHEHYDSLANPSGYTKENIESGNPEAMEWAVCFLECRPYFFRSGYMFQKLLRICKRAPLSAEQATRFGAVIQKYTDWKASKKAQRGR